jgi:hypothetical protein
MEEGVAMLIRTLLVTGLVLGFSGAAVEGLAKEKRERLPPKGSTIILKQAVETDFDSARAYMQFGKAVAKKDLHEFYPTCYLYLKTVKQGGTQTIQPARFTVRKSANFRQQGFSMAPGRWEVAASRIDGLELAQGGDLYMMSDMKLEPNPQEVLSLTCFIRYSYGTAITPFLFLDEIDKVLGEVVTIEPPSEQ